MATLKLKTILIIEDDQDILFSLHILLEGEGYAVQTAENGAIALDFLKTHDIPDLILLDMQMPVMSGWDFAAEFATKYDHLCPIVVMTAAANAEKRARDINAVEWIEKPFDLNKLLTIIEKYVV